MALVPDAGSDLDLVSRAVSALARATHFPVAFGGLAESGVLSVTAMTGARTHHLDGLVVHAGRGLGGRSLVERRPRLTLDYRTARGITHDYDRAILGEGISTLLAIPVMVGGRARGVLYCGSWREAAVGDVIARPAFAVAESLAMELHVRAEVERRVAEMSAPDPVVLGSAAREELRESFAELRRVAATISDESVKRRLAAIEHTLSTLSGTGTTEAIDVSLSPREIDVLASVAVGATNSEIAASLGLKEVTVKSYLQAAMAKLDVSTRHAAVTKARRAGILP